jgi:hypothetical protein
LWFKEERGGGNFLASFFSPNSLHLTLFIVGISLEHNSLSSSNLLSSELSNPRLSVQDIKPLTPPPISSRNPIPLGPFLKIEAIDGGGGGGGEEGGVVKGVEDLIVVDSRMFGVLWTLSHVVVVINPSPDPEGELQTP